MEAHIERILWTQDQIAARVSELATQISSDLVAGSSPPVFVGVATGALLFLADLVRQIKLPITVDFIRVESYGSGTESSGKPRISSDLKLDVAGKHVILVVDFQNFSSFLTVCFSRKCKGEFSFWFIVSEM